MSESKGLFRRVWDAIRNRPRLAAPAVPDAPVQPTGPYEPPPEPVPLVVPGAGDVFDLHVIVHLRWQSPPDKRLSYERAEELSRVYHDTAMNSVLKRVWQLARSLDPLYPAQAETEMNNDPQLRRGWCFGDENGTVQCVPTVRVFLDPKLREHKNPFEIQRLSIEEEHNLGMARDELVRTRTESWLRGFQELETFADLGKDERQFLLPYAASLSDERLAKVTTVLARDRHQRYTDLVGLLKVASNDHERLGLFEFANAYDKALQTFCRQMGVGASQWMLADFGEPEAVDSPSTGASQ
ncbi:hypothetical protein NLX85_18250 [Micromonospora sp. A3M-1-15]|uniref:hypothetical protein n=1 Tax=Micromonospora sp. A3M-1-15 TaxID=2962035 RepID=UPI0020B7D215|nr:hypothetical protein [Micromonospora sp. A3M-1-15]MCP3785305.1 hypothetical protein [Micromonospora sp. A3M-1-15]